MSTYNVPDSLTQTLNYQISLDGAAYSARIFFMYFGQRTYMTLTDQYGNTVFTLPLIGSPKNEAPINMVAGYFTASVMHYYPADQQIVVLP